MNAGPCRIHGRQALAQQSPAADIVVGIDTHKHVHAAVALSALGARLAATTVPASRAGYGRLAAWARSLGTVKAFGVEGTGSYGAGLARALREAGHRVLEVNRPDRSARRRNGKDDMLDAEAAARAVLAGQATAEPKAGTSSVEMIRHIRIARDAAVKARTQGDADDQVHRRRRPRGTARAARRHRRPGDVHPSLGCAPARTAHLDHGVRKGGPPGERAALAHAPRGDRGA
ncbi:IS110 family transposase [Dankookia rubra]|uniref:IS110 family transposase n=1 Tax=Dankookia rubra TaxID=1442381 RepID=UPI0034DE26CC